MAFHDLTDTYGGTVAAGASYTVPDGFASLVVVNDKDSTGNVTLTLSKGSYVLEPGEWLRWEYKGTPFKSVVITSAVGAEAKYSYHN